MRGRSAEAVSLGVGMMTDPKRVFATARLALLRIAAISTYCELATQYERRRPDAKSRAS
jgi:hypothetical protein